MSIKTNELPGTTSMADSDSFLVTTAAGTRKTPLSWLRGLFAPAPLTKNLTLYVNASTGSDSNDGLDPGRSKRTIQAAVNAVPKLLQGYRAIINIADGSYDEVVSITGFLGGQGIGDGYLSSSGIALRGETKEKTIIRAIVVETPGTRVSFSNLTVGFAGGSSYGVAVMANSNLYMTNCIIDHNSTYTGEATKAGVIASNCLIALSGCSIRTVNGDAAASVLCGVMQIFDSEITSDTLGISSAGIAILGNTSITAETDTQKASGGIVFKDGVLA